MVILRRDGTYILILKLAALIKNTIVRFGI